jgi:branched-chain amino acid transport system permease protein
MSIIAQLIAFGLSNGAIIALNALGVTLIYSVVRTVNFAYGDLFALSSVLVVQIVLLLGLRADGAGIATLGGLLVALVAAIGFGAIGNAAIERVVFRPFRGRSQLAPLIAGIAVSFMLFQFVLTWRTLAEVGFGNPEHHSDVDNLANVPHFGIPKLIPEINLAALLGLPLRYSLRDLLILLLALGLALGVTWFLQRTKAGRALRACAQDPDMALLCGIDRDRALQGVFALGGGLAGAAAFIFAIAYERPFGQHGAESGLLAFTAAVLGGIGSPIGALVAGLLLGILASFSDFFLPAQWTPVLVLATLIVLLTLRPTGLNAEDSFNTNAQPTTPPPHPSASTWVAHLRQQPIWRIVLGGALLILLSYPWLDQWLNLQRLPIINNMLIFAMLALGLHIVLGMAGMLDLGFAACFAVGGYTAALLIQSPFGRSADFGLVLLTSIVAAGVFGGLNGLLTLRVRGDYLAVVALAFGQLVPRVVVNIAQWTGGSGGIAALPPPRIFGMVLATQAQRYYLALLLLAGVWLLCMRLADSRLGRAWAALSSDELAATSCGISLAGVKPLAFMLGAAVAGVAAALSATIFGYVDPDQSDFRISAMTLAMVVIGGGSGPFGVIGGAFLIAGYDQILLPGLSAWWEAAFGDRLPIHLAELNYLAFGLALYLTVRWRGRHLAV